MSIRVGSFFNILIQGGFAREPELTPDALALDLCHEFGHGYGGEPLDKSNIEPFSLEGQDDYYGAKICMPQILKTFSNPLEDSEVTPFMQKKCAEFAHSDSEKALICVRQLAAALSLTQFFEAYRRKQGVIETPASFETPSTVVVNSTLQNYPPPKCRLDTYLAGTLQLPRPSCWYWE
ncbi:MAG: hypothetical protein WCI18_12125 [Pseudomonadota bacterium]